MINSRLDKVYRKYNLYFYSKKYFVFKKYHYLDLSPSTLVSNIVKVLGDPFIPVEDKLYVLAYYSKFSLINENHFSEIQKNDMIRSIRQFGKSCQVVQQLSVGKDCFSFFNELNHFLHIAVQNGTLPGVIPSEHRSCKGFGDFIINGVQVECKTSIRGIGARAPSFINKLIWKYKGSDVIYVLELCESYELSEKGVVLPKKVVRFNFNTEIVPRLDKLVADYLELEVRGDIKIISVEEMLYHHRMKQHFLNTAKIEHVQENFKHQRVSLPFYSGVENSSFKKPFDASLVGCFVVVSSFIQNTFYSFLKKRVYFYKKNFLLFFTCRGFILFLRRLFFSIFKRYLKFVLMFIFYYFFGGWF